MSTQNICWLQIYIYIYIYIDIYIYIYIFFFVPVNVLKNSVTKVKSYGIWNKTPSVKITSFTSETLLAPKFISYHFSLTFIFKCVDVFVCVHFMLFVIPLESCKTWALSSEYKLTELIFKIGCPSLYLP